MDVSLHIAWILGPYLLIMGIWLLIMPDKALKLMAAFKKTGNSEMLIYYGAFMSLIFGLLLLSFYREWVQSWEVIITIFGWLAVVKGVLLLFKPEMLTAIKLSKSTLVIASLAWIAVGAVLVNAVHNFG